MPSAEPNPNVHRTPEPIPVPSSAGALLGQRRKEKNLTIQYVASQLRLDPRVIQALEADDFESFAADTYIRGYLRSYAKLLGLDGDKVVGLYQVDAREPPEIIPDVRHPTQVSSSDKPVKAFTYLVTFILFLLVAIWWWQGNFKNPVGLLSTPGQGPVVTDTRYQQTNPPADPGLPAPEAIDPGLQVPADPPQELEDSTVTGTADTGADQPVVAPGPVEGDDQASTAAGDTTVPAVATAADITGATEENIALPGPDQVYLRLNADCWIEILDRYGKEVYVDLARTGEELHLNGFAPFQVKLGNAQGVVLEFNQQSVDPAPYTTKGIARFSLGN